MLSGCFPGRLVVVVFFFGRKSCPENDPPQSRKCEASLVVTYHNGSPDSWLKGYHFHLVARRVHFIRFHFRSNCQKPVSGTTIDCFFEILDILFVLIVKSVLFPKATRHTFIRSMERCYLITSLYYSSGKRLCHGTKALVLQQANVLDLLAFFENWRNMF